MQMCIKHSGVASITSDCVQDHVWNFASSACGRINVHVGGYGYLTFLEVGVIDDLMLKLVPLDY